MVLALLAKNRFVLAGGEVNRELEEFSLKVVAPLGPAFKIEGLLRRQVQAGEIHVPLPNLSRLVALKEALVHGLFLQLLLLLRQLLANLNSLPTDADLVGLPLDQVNRDGGVGEGVETMVDIHQGGTDFLLLDALLALTPELLTVLSGDA